MKTAKVQKKKGAKNFPEIWGPIKSEIKINSSSDALNRQQNQC